MSTLDYTLLPKQKHEWKETPEKPWTCGLCGFTTANLRHIKNGHCFHEWKALPGTDQLKSCARCGIVLNSRNSTDRCIGRVSVGLRKSDIEDCSDPRGKVLARNAALEEAAKVCDEHASYCDQEAAESQSKHTKALWRIRGNSARYLASEIRELNRLRDWPCILMQKGQNDRT